MTQRLFDIDKVVLAGLAKAASDAEAKEFVLNVAKDRITATVSHAQAIFETVAPVESAVETALGISTEKLAAALKSLKSGDAKNPKAGLVSVAANGARIVFSQPGRSVHIGNLSIDHIETPRFMPDAKLAVLTTSFAPPDKAEVADMLRSFPPKVRVVVEAKADGTVQFRHSDKVDGFAFDLPCAIEGPPCKSGYNSSWLKATLSDATRIRFGPNLPMLTEHAHGRALVMQWVALDGEEDD